MIEAVGLSKQYGDKLAVDHIDFVVEPGKVTGFLGPNGAGKSTTMRMIVDLDRPTTGHVTVNGKRYRDHHSPLTEVGVLLEAKAVHTGRSAYNHLLAIAATHGISSKRVGEVIDLTGLGTVAKRRAGSFSLGMGQRLGIAVALLGDPRTLILDEPVNGLDPEGVRWVRMLLRHLASEGKTVLLSSHLMSEMAQTADQLIVIGRGRIIANAAVDDIVKMASGASVIVRSPDAERLAGLLARPDVSISAQEPTLFEVHGLGAPEIGAIAAASGIVLHELTPTSASLEEAFMELTADDVEYHAGAIGGEVSA